MSIVFQPDNSTIQFGDSQGNIPHNGVLSSNIVGTDVLPPTFPTTSTGTSLGHYHYTNSSSFALQLLNVSGSGDGGHEFWNCSNTNAPVKYFTINKNNAVLDTRLLNSTGKTVLDLTGNSLTVTSSNNRFQNSVQTYQILMTDGTLNLQNTITSDKVQVSDGNLNTSSTIRSGLIQIGDNTDLSTLSQTQLQIGKRTGNLVSTLTDLNLNITDTANTNTSVLSANDLTFNSVSLKTQVATNTSDIATINTNIASLPSLIIKQTTTSNQGLSLAIFADGKPAIAPTSTISQQYAFTPSWYFKNTFLSNNKINWYFGSPIGLTVSNLLGVYMNMFSASMTSNDLCPFITIYTQPQSGDSTFYHSKRTYIFNQSITPIINTRYFNFANISGTCPTPQIPSPSNLINMQLSTVSGSNVGPFLPTELILTLTIGSNSAATINTVEFAINKFGFMTSTGSQEINLISS